MSFQVFSHPSSALTCADERFMDIAISFQFVKILDNIDQTLKAGNAAFLSTILQHMKKRKQSGLSDLLILLFPIASLRNRKKRRVQ